MPVTRIILALWILISAMPATAATVGFTIRTIKGAPAPLDVAIWYPAKGTPMPHKIGQLDQRLVRDGRVEGRHLPLIVISHGTGGDDTSYADTAYALAQSGFVVAAPTHIGDNPRDHSHALDIAGRAAQISRVIDYMIAGWRPDGIDPERIGAFGHSAGGMTMLIAAGGNPDLSLLGPHCAKSRDFFDCRLISGGGKDPSHLAASYPTTFPHDRRIRALVIAAPALGFAFAGNGLADVRIPVQLWRAADDELLPSPFYVEPVRQALPTPPDYHVVPHALHGDFAAPCPPRSGDAESQACKSEAGFDRAAFHLSFNHAIVSFFAGTLKGTEKAF